MTPAKSLHCEAENCPFGGELPYDRRAMGLGEWTDKIVIAACGLLVTVLIGVIVWFGGKVDKLTEKVQNLSEMQGVYLERLSTNAAETGRLRVELGQLRNDVDFLRIESARHEKEDRQKFISVVRERGGK